MNATKRSWTASRILLVFAMAVLSATTVIPRAWGKTSAVDPEAVRILKRMTDQLAAQQKFSVRLQVVIEDVDASGHRVDSDVSNNVTIKRPNKLVVKREGAMNQRFYYDGKSITLYNSRENVYATKPAPATLEGMIALARESVGIVLPAADLVYRNAFSLFTKDLTFASVVGKTVINGVECYHLAFSRPGVDFQIWVAAGDKPWPVKYVVTDTDTPSKLSISTIMSDWDTNPAVDDAQFTFVPPKGATQIEFIESTESASTQSAKLVKPTGGRP